MPFGLHMSASDLDLLPQQEKAVAVAKQEPNMDEAGFGVFYAETSRSLFGYLLRVSGDRALAEDLLQEAYCRLLCTDLPSMDHSRRRSYLFRIATNLMRDRWRRRQETSLPENLSETMVSAPLLERKLEMRQAFARLKPRERQLLYLAYVEGANHKEIADSTGLRARSVRLLLFRARRKLAGFIGVNLPCSPESSKEVRK